MPIELPGATTPLWPRLPPIVPLPLSVPLLATLPVMRPLLIAVPVLPTLPMIVPTLPSVPVLLTVPTITPLLLTVPALLTLPMIMLWPPLFSTAGWATVTWEAARPALIDAVPCWTVREPPPSVSCR